MKEEKHPVPLDSQERQQVQRITYHPRWILIRLCQVTVHIVCIVMYLIPILQPNEYGGPTLDEIHIMSPDQKDIHDPSTSMKTIFSNDYWGRPMNAPNSHKSWRPLTILSFRYLKSMGGILSFLSSLVGNHHDSTQLQLTTHRIINILTHAAAGEMVGILATQLLLFTTASVPWLLQLIVKLLFCLHPTHVEVTANAANRNHILAVLCSTILCFPSQHGTSTTSTTTTSTTTPIWLFVPTLVAGYLASETFLFQIPAAMVTMVVITYNNNQQQQQQQQQQRQQQQRVVLIDYIQAVYSQWPRLLLLGSSIGIYYGGRAYFDTLDIPEGLIRPAENPFYHFVGIHRVRNYLYVIALHLHKSWWIVPFLPNPLGFSHEYGYDCIPAIESWDEERMVSVYVMGLVLLVSLVIAMISLFSKRSHAGTVFGMIAIHWAWMLSLFPISGLVKVGTFVSDRIVVASTVSVTWILGILLYWYLVECFANNNKLPFRPLQGILLLWWIMTSYMTIHHRTLEWMDSISLLNSALETCPRFAKAHMEVSKIHSGLFPSLFNLTKSRYHLEIARDIDPNLCDVHQQFAHVSIQQGRYREYEEELTQAVLCPFTMGGALPMWQRYWQIALESAPPGTLQRTEVEERQTYYTRIIQEAVQEAQRTEEEKTRTTSSQQQKNKKK
ncbi:DUF1736 domain containing protein [Nitzschia inconspicua]|uniref:DUF1736 domain containing protein n=1 Tax=Nitzschia inconspicua TaxID=303405 RepID=A0A9K3K3U7_9STRA|nr:DUF1736 domain containing protein [Nitzschia inconspicua]KAG7361939.1 DUF1736 domain containing protein [Nitzschia inconspicua]